MTKTRSQGNETPFLQMLRHRHLVKLNQGILIGHTDMAAADAVVGNSERVCKRSVHGEG